ncbi:MAG TPA: hypothetical protein VFU11_05260 [Solirubrobacterales bacterium]|nr:hypothetical protein [Solirubrobacterales bacterium]
MPGGSPGPRSHPVVIVSAGVNGAEGSRAAAAALACAASTAESASLFVDVGGRTPRPTLLSSKGAQRLEERLQAHFAKGRVAARGQICQLVVDADVAGLKALVKAVSVTAVDVAVVHLPLHLVGIAPRLLPELDISGVLLRADLPAARPRLAPLVLDLMGRGFTVGTVKHRLSWVAERRALFGALSAEARDGLPRSIVRRLLGDLITGSRS